MLARTGAFTFYALMLSVCTGLLSTPAFSALCQVSSPKDLAFFGSIEKGKTFFYSSDGEPDSSPIIVSACESSRSFLMIGMGAEQSKVVSDVQEISFDGKLIDDHCRIENSPLAAPLPFEEKAQNYRERTELLRQCIEIEVTELLRPRINFPTEQPGCEIRQTLPNQFVFSGGSYCFVRPGANSMLGIHVRMRNECANAKFLSEHGIRPQDVQGVLNLYVAGDATGASTDLTQIHSLPIRTLIDPNPNVIAVGDETGLDLPRWPSVWAPKDIHMGDIRMQIRGRDRFEIEVPYLVDNRCDSVCKNGECVSPCDYALPVVAKVTLREVSASGRTRELNSWQNGGVAAPRWQGMLRGLSYIWDGGDIRDGGTYEIEALFSDPYEDFTLFRSQLQQILIDISRIGNLSGDSDELPVLEDIGDLGRGLGLGDIPPINLEDPDSLRKALALFRKYMGSKAWPPVYGTTCDATLSSCVKFPAQGDYLRLTTRFKVTLQEDRSYLLSEISVRRNSPILPSYSRTVEHLPTVSCGPQDI